MPAPVTRSQEPAEAPAGMAWIPGGEFSMGSEEPAFRDASPLHRVRVGDRNRCAQSCTARADDDDIGFEDLHRFTLLRWWRCA